MIQRDAKVTISLDGRPCEVAAGTTILEAARRHGVYIPTLCTLEGLSPFGACRMCLVEVEGVRGFPAACTTPVQDGMVVRTETEKVRNLRREVLRLTLSHHPCGCIVCDESEECRAHSETTRKAGVTTGCRTCPNDGACELQDVAVRIGLEGIDLPVYYRGLPAEKDDPFYDRDYNLCILCGRCVRVCQDVRGVGTLAFQRRGARTIVGPAYGRTHIESGCEFCGACVSACPTGALSEKVRKWDGAPEREVETTCPLCGLGCRIRLLARNGRVIGSLPAEVPGGGGKDGAAEPPGEGGDAPCVKGRFCLAEIVNDHRRPRTPYVVQENARIEIDWQRAVGIAAEKLASCPPEKFALLVSANCTNEDLYIAQKFARVAMRSNNVDTGAGAFYGQGFAAYLNLMKLAASVSDIGKASVILAVGLDTRFGRSGVGLAIRSAVRRGAKLITIHPRGHNLSLPADEWLRPPEGGMGEALESFAGAKLLAEAESPLVIVGPDAVHGRDGARVLGLVEKLARAAGARVLALPAQNNLFGSILMGAYPELLPGGFAFSDADHRAAVEKVWGVNPRERDAPPVRASSTDADAREGLDVLYLVGDVPSDERPRARFVIYQNIAPPPGLGYADLVLPAAAFSETDGTVVVADGRLRRVRKAVDPPGEARPDWEILSRVATRLGVKGFEFAGVRHVHDEIARLVDGFGDFESLALEPLAFVCDGETVAEGAAEDAAETPWGGAPGRASETPREGVPDPAADAPRGGTSWDAPENAYPLTLVVSLEENVYRGFPISAWVGGAREIFPEGRLDLSPEDAGKKGIADGDEVVVWSTGFERVFRARVSDAQTEGSLRVTLRRRDLPPGRPLRVDVRKKDV